MSRTFFTDILEKYPSALCAQTEPDLFFPEKGAHEVAKVARKVCASCIHKAECLEDALDRREMFGIWGGLSETERGALIKRRKQVAA